MDKSKSYYYQVLILILIAVASFYGFKRVLPERLFSEKVKGNDNIVVDSLMLQAMNDTTSLFTEPVDTIVEPDKPKRVEVLKVEVIDGSFDPELTANGYQNLSCFYAKLQSLEEESKTKVRVAYFGDSMNDGDLIVQDIRANFQEEYGGRGVGFVSITSLSANARGTVRHQFSGNWLTQSSVKVRKPDSPFGLDGQVFFAKSNNAWVRYRAQGFSHAESLYGPTLYYGKSSNDSATVVVKADKRDDVILKLQPKYALNKVRLIGSAQSLELHFNKADSIPIYGVNFDNGAGVHVDNFSIRGNSGLPLSVLNTGLMNAFDRNLGYDLIVIQYGANVLSSTTKSYDWYEKSMTSVISHLHNCFPNADVLILSTADKSSMIEGQMQTDPAVALLAIAQRNYARNTNSGFINLYKLMGGEDSMITWVNNKLANKDYTHFNISGSKKIGKLIYQEILAGYAKYKENPPLESINLTQEEDESNELQ